MIWWVAAVVVLGLLLAIGVERLLRQLAIRPAEPAVREEGSRALAARITGAVRRPRPPAPRPE